MKNGLPVTISACISGQMGSEGGYNGWYDEVSPGTGSRLRGRLAQLVRALPLQGRGPGFESLTAHHVILESTTYSDYDMQ